MHQVGCRFLNVLHNVFTVNNFRFEDNSFNVSVGSLSLLEPRTIYERKAGHIHPNSNVGLIELKQKMIFNDKVKPVKLPKSSKEPLDDFVTLVGWIEVFFFF